MKICAIACVIGWLAFWVFGYLAFMSEDWTAPMAGIYMLIAFVGFITGVFTYLRLSRGTC